MDMQTILLVMLFSFGCGILFYPFYKILERLLCGEPENKTSAAPLIEILPEGENQTSAAPLIEPLPEGDDVGVGRATAGDPHHVEVRGDSRRFRWDVIGKLISSESGLSLIRNGDSSNVFRVSFPDESSLAVLKIYRNLNQASFKEELETLLRISHLNVPRLIGYSDDGAGALLFEYFPKGNLHDHLHNQSTNFPWHHRTSIAYKVGYTIHQLHENHIIHGNIKSSHILLDSKLNPKLCDFHSSVRFDPENLNSGSDGPTTKTDVYSFGILLLELLSGDEQVDGIGDATKAEELVDSRLNGQYDSEEVVAMASIAGMCVREDASEKPSMLGVLRFMEDKVPSVNVDVVE
ncbi:putative receptor-like protein kinase [Acorus calamus]|uniref:Receptor-like protein kinase n=1 Tax=Acorus calamus TaxID=4465 RepID=A0AAV9D3V1_ACOCL|nr:putative receptor-like protein kinase [Acorus calamus]